MQPASEDFAAAERLFLEGNRHMADGDAQRAEWCFREAIRHVPDLAEAHANLGLLLDQGGRQIEAEIHYLHAIVCNPDLGQNHLNLGALLAGQKRFEESEAAYRRALQLIPDSASAWSNLGVVQACRKQEAEAEQSYRVALELDPCHQSARFNLSYLLLRQGRFEDGWRCLEARDGYAVLQNSVECPRWRGEPLDGKSLLIGFEAGHGDMIQFCRYTTVLKARGARTIAVICHPALKTLFATLDGLDAAIPLDEGLPVFDWDFWTPPLSIPFYCETRLDTIPARLPYLRADEERRKYWSSRMAGDSVPGDLRIGLVWKGNPRFENDADRSLPNLDMLIPLGSISGVRFFSLQKGAGEDDATNPPAGLPLVNLGPQIQDFAEAAAIVANLDVVICVDTAIAHLAGALGKTCWVLLPDYKTDWRWLSGRSDSPWYPGVMRLFRQSRMGDWTTVIAELCAALQERVDTPIAA
jgi:Tfp pilus assembly protein PilF